MRIKHLHIYGFGKLVDFELAFNQEFQVLYGENEVGKSTIFAFIQAMLFGFPSKAASGPSFEPVHAMTYGGYLLIEKEDRTVVKIERIKKKTGSEVRLSYEDGQVGDEGDLQQLIAGMDRNFFERIYAFNLSGLADVSRLNEEELGKFLFYTGISGSDALYQIETNLTKKMEQLYKPGGSKPIINAELKQLQESQKELKQAQENEAAYNQLVALSDEMTAKLAESRERMQQLQADLLEKKEQKRLLPLIKERNHLQRMVTEETITHVQGLKNLDVVVDKIETLEKEVDELQIEIGYLDKQMIQIRQNLAMDFPDELLSELDTSLFVRDQIRQLENEKQLYSKQLEDSSQQEQLHRDRLKQLNKQKMATESDEISEEKQLLPMKPILLTVSAAMALASVLLFFLAQSQIWPFTAIGAILLGMIGLLLKEKAVELEEQSDTTEVKWTLSLENEQQNLEMIEKRKATLEAQLTENGRQLVVLGEQLQLPERIALNMLSVAFEEIGKWKELLIERDLLKEKIAHKQAWVEENKVELARLALICNVVVQENLREMALELTRAAEQAERLVLLQTQIGNLDFLEASETEVELSIATLTEELDQVEQARLEMQRQQSETEVKRKQLEEAGTVESKRYIYQAKLEQFQGNVKEWMKQAIAKGILEQTIRINKEEKLPQILAKAEQYLTFLTNARYQKLFFDEIGQVLLLGSESGELIQAKDISRGTAELVYTVIRLAFAEHLEQQQIWPIIMDDTFVNLDSKRMERMSELLQTIGQTQQIIFFTCHEHLLPSFSDENIIQLGEKELVGSNL